MSFAKTCLSLLAGAAVLAPSLFADAVPCKIFQSNMVLQRETPVPVWGTASPGEEVSVSFAGQTVSGKADEKGAWCVTLQPLKTATEGTDLVIKGKNEITLKNVVVGDVWLCGGQSNMEMNFQWGILDGKKFIEESAKYPLIRRVKFNKTTSTVVPKDPPVGEWSVCGPQTVPAYTACGYFFAVRLLEETGIPIGILDDNWSGSPIEPFIPTEAFGMTFQPKDKEEEQILAWFKRMDSTLKLYDLSRPESKERMLKEIDVYRKYIKTAEEQIAQGKVPPAPPATLYTHRPDNRAWNIMMAPIVRFPIKGAIWYQGCANGGEGNSYYYKMKALIEGWRAAWKIDFPVYFVQLAPYWKRTADPAGGNGYARIREAQRRSMSIPKTGMACTIDIGMEYDIHPKNKQDVGARLALWALRDVYGKKDTVVSGPLFKSMKIEGNSVRLSFDYADGLCTAQKTGYAAPVPTPDKAPKHFAVAGADKVWHWADAKIDGKDIVLSSPKVPAPVAVRYAYRAYPDGVNVYNGAGLPMVPFRTDNW